MLLYVIHLMTVCSHWRWPRSGCWRLMFCAHLSSMVRGRGPLKPTWRPQSSRWTTTTKKRSVDYTHCRAKSPYTNWRLRNTRLDCQDDRGSVSDVEGIQTPVITATSLWYFICMVMHEKDVCDNVPLFVKTTIEFDWWFGNCTVAFGEGVFPELTTGYFAANNKKFGRYLFNVRCHGNFKLLPWRRRKQLLSVKLKSTTTAAV